MLKVDDKEVANQKVPHTVPFIMSIDTRTPVDDGDYNLPFPFTGKLGKVAFKLGPHTARRKMIKQLLAKSNN